MSLWPFELLGKRCLSPFKVAVYQRIRLHMINFIDFSFSLKNVVLDCVFYGHFWTRRKRKTQGSFSIFLICVINSQPISRLTCLTSISRWLKRATRVEYCTGNYCKQERHNDTNTIHHRLTLAWSRRRGGRRKKTVGEGGYLGLAAQLGPGPLHKLSATAPLPWYFGKEQEFIASCMICLFTAGPTAPRLAPSMNEINTH